MNIKREFTRLALAAVMIGLGTIAIWGEAFANAASGGVMEINKTRPFVKMISNVVYAQVPSRGFDNVAMKMDILKPQSKTTLPVIVYVNGGGFINVNKDGYIQQRMDLAEAGYVVASIQYRVAPTATFPQPLEDVKAAIRFLNANSQKYGIVKNNVGIMGGSAGGYLAAMTGVTNGVKKFDVGEHLNESSKVKAVVDTYGVSDLTKIGEDFGPENEKLHASPGATEALWVNGSGVFGGKDGGINAVPEATKNAQIFTYITKDAPPYLIFYGTNDKVVSPSQSKHLYDALRAKNVDAVLIEVKDAKHGGDYWVQPGIMSEVIAFFNSYLKH